MVDTRLNVSKWVGRGVPRFFVGWNGLWKAWGSVVMAVSRIMIVRGTLRVVAERSNMFAL